MVENIGNGSAELVSYAKLNLYLDVLGKDPMNTTK